MNAEDCMMELASLGEVVTIKRFTYCVKSRFAIVDIYFTLGHPGKRKMWKCTIANFGFSFGDTPLSAFNNLLHLVKEESKRNIALADQLWISSPKKSMFHRFKAWLFRMWR